MKTELAECTTESAKKQGRRRCLPRITRETPLEQLPVWLTPDEVALYIDRSAASIRQSLTLGTGTFTGRKIGGRWYINRANFAEPKIERFFGRKRASYNNL
jgi:hypothetical protein